jgi:hypothetical protein
MKSFDRKVFLPYSSSHTKVSAAEDVHVWRGRTHSSQSFNAKLHGRAIIGHVQNTKPNHYCLWNASCYNTLTATAQIQLAQMQANALTSRLGPFFLLLFKCEFYCWMPQMLSTFESILDAMAQYQWGT